LALLALACAQLLGSLNGREVVFLGNSNARHCIAVVAQHVAQRRPCVWNGMKRPCYLFARKFYPEALGNLMNIFSNFTVI
jgi:hypothetical protein